MSLIFGVVGFPIQHSLSPAFHNGAFSHQKIDAEYVCFEVRPEDLENFMHRVRRENIRGLSVTLPHKEKIMAFLDEIDERAKKIGAVNTVINKNGILKGYNTDWEAAQRALEEVTALEEKNIVVVGAGGAALSVIYACKEAGASVTVLNRTEEKAKKVAEHFGVKSGFLGDILQYPADILIQTTSVGMAPNNKKSPVPKEYFSRYKGKSAKVAMDIVYTPMETRFLKDAARAGWKTIMGIKMFLYQAERQFEMWTGEMAKMGNYELKIKNYELGF